MDWQAWRDGILDLVFPRHCVSCGDDVTDDSPHHFSCKSCADSWFYVKAPCCPTCGYPYFGAMLHGDRSCSKCQDFKPDFRQGRTLLLVEGAVRQWIHALKYHQGTFLLEDLEQVLRQCEGLANYLNDALLVPVPLHPRKLRERGYNQSLLICQTLKKVYPDTEVCDELTRLTDTPSQTQFNRKERQKNLRKAFSYKNKTVTNPHRRRILVDDVFTTGATLNACTRAMNKAGIQCIDILTLGHG